MCLIQVERLRQWRGCYGSLNVYTFFDSSGSKNQITDIPLVKEIAVEACAEISVIKTKKIVIHVYMCSYSLSKRSLIAL